MAAKERFDIHDYDRQLRRTLNRIKDHPRISEANKGILNALTKDPENLKLIAEALAKLGLVDKLREI